MSLIRRLKPLLLTILFTTVIIVAACSVAGAQTRPTLTWGWRGQSVRLAQWKLSEWGYLRGRVDGVYGAQTYRAVLAFQRRNGLTVDGKVGPTTWRALGFGYTVAHRAAATTSARRTSSYSSSVDLLARVVAAEAQGEPYRGQVAVAAVMLNRVQSGRFPNSLSGVVFQPHALESVTNGLVWRRTPSSTAYAAARDAVNGYDPTYGCMFFWNPYKPVSGWIWTRNIVTQIGRHVFAR